MSDKVINLDVKNDNLGRQVVDTVFRVHQELGAGLLESIYEECLAIALKKRNIQFRKQVSMPISYEGVDIPNAFKIDFIVEDSIILELKAVEKIIPVHEAQLLTYMKLSKIRTGFLINFNTKLIKDGIKRYRL
ncbi:MAG TPA: GxxExxY protein [Alphaproteobacteria bacterium]|nr:GxxExxY protein [Alphaproteobacteria bacterium]HOO52213.1 GxxExxY protein [Alphaproteobacteria bacterium]